MAYATVAEIEADFKDVTFSTTTLVKTADVNQFIVEADALVNSYVAAKYETPVASGEGLQLLKLCTRSLVAARIKKILEVKQEKSVEANQNVVGVLLSPTQVMKILKDIQSGDAELIGADALVDNGGFYSQNYEDDVEPVVKKTEKQW
jgi:hypothetical protein